jgi:hypothetical protein
MNPQESFYSSKTEPNRSCLLTLRSIILDIDENVTETTKYGMPCFCYKNKMFCYLWTDKKTTSPYILFVEGNYLEHPKLETGTRKRMKVLNINPNKDIQIQTVQLLLNKAINLYKDGAIKIK